MSDRPTVGELVAETRRRIGRGHTQHEGMWDAPLAEWRQWMLEGELSRRLEDFYEQAHQLPRLVRVVNTKTKRVIVEWYHPAGWSTFAPCNADEIAIVPHGSWPWGDPPGAYAYHDLPRQRLRWIPVSEDRPDHNRMVWVWPGEHRARRHEDGVFRLYDSSPLTGLSEPTHWMDPGPPEAQS